MNFPELDIENFLAITKATINLADRGLALIQGVNSDDTSADSNGSGKSSLADALCWVWFGETARGVTGDDVVNNIAGKGCRVSSKVVDGSITYTATRHRKHKTGKNSLTIFADDGFKVTDLTKGTDKLTQDVALKIIGSSLDVFKAAVYAGQEQMPDLPAMTDKHLKMLIEEAAGVTVLEAAYKIARADHAVALASVEKAVSDIEVLLDRRNFYASQVTDQEAQQAAWHIGQKAAVASLNTQVAALVPQIKAFDLSFDEVVATAKIAELDARIAAVASENTELVRLERAVGQAASNQQLTKIASRQLADGIARANTALTEVEHKIGCPCDECGRPMTDAELGAAKEAATKKLNLLLSQEAVTTDAEGAANTAFVSAVGARDAFKLTMTDISATSAERASLQLQCSTKASIVAQRSAMLQKARDLKAESDRKAAESDPFAAGILALANKIFKTDEDVVALQLQLDAETKALELEAANVKLYGPAGVRAHILDEVTPYLNTQTSQYLSTLSDGNMEANWTTLVTTGKGDLREKFSIEVINEHGSKSFKGLSGGEKRKVRVATALALQDLVATRATKPIDLFIGDEIDDALDPAGLERLTQILEDKAKERGSVFVISHHSLRDWISQVVTIEKKGGETFVTEETL